MSETADIREWRGHDVVDVDGHKIGTLEAVYVDTGTDEPSFGTVKVGLPTRNRLVFASLTGATVDRSGWPGADGASQSGLIARAASDVFTFRAIATRVGVEDASTAHIGWHIFVTRRICGGEDLVTVANSPTTPARKPFGSTAPPPATTRGCPCATVGR